MELGCRFRILALMILALLALWLPPGVHAITVDTRLQPHAPIHIDGNNGFTPANGVVSGSGTTSDPYIIEGWEFNLTLPYQEIPWPRAMVDVWNASASFRIQGLRFSGGGNGNLQWALELRNVTNAVISDSLFSSTYTGAISIGYSSNVTVEKSGFSMFGGEGLSTYNSTKVTIAENSFLGTGGVALSSSAAVSVYHNNFWGPQGEDDNPSANRWDNGYPSGGNYWSRYMNLFVDNCNGPKQDICPGPDGIADNPHYISDSCPCPTGTDRYPLMKSFSLAPDNVPPTFPFPTSLMVRGLAMTSVTLSWQNATDDVGIIGYRVYWQLYSACIGTSGFPCMNGVLAGTVSPGTNDFTVSGLSPGVRYLIWVEAGDSSENWVLGVYADVTTYTIWQQYWYLFAAGGLFLVALLLLDEHVKERRKGRRGAIQPPRSDHETRARFPRIG